MRGFWSETNWRLEGADLIMPSGQRIALKHVRQWQNDRLIGCYDLTGKWPGWRVRQQWLIAPGGTLRRGRIAERTLRHVVQTMAWAEQDVSRRQLALFPDHTGRPGPPGQTAEQRTHR